MPTNIQRKSLILNTGIYGSGNDQPQLRLSYELPLSERKERIPTLDRIMLETANTTDSTAVPFPSLVNNETFIEMRSPEEPVRIDRLKEAATIWNSQVLNSPTAIWSDRTSQQTTMYDERGWNKKALEYLENSMTVQRYNTL